MLLLSEKETFIHEWAYWRTHVADMLPASYQRSDNNLGYLQVPYTLLPLDGRHQDARYRLEIEFSIDTSAPEFTIGQRSSTFVLRLQSDVLSDGFAFLTGYGPDGERLLEFEYDHEVAREQLGDVSRYESITATLEYQEALLDSQADQYDSLEDARGRFEEYVSHQNETLGWDKDPSAKFTAD